MWTGAAGDRILGLCFLFPRLGPFTTICYKYPSRYIARQYATMLITFHTPHFILANFQYRQIYLYVEYHNSGADFIRLMPTPNE